MQATQPLAPVGKKADLVRRNVPHCKFGSLCKADQHLGMKIQIGYDGLCFKPVPLPHTSSDTATFFVPCCKLKLYIEVLVVSPEAVANHKTLGVFNVCIMLCLWGWKET